MFCRITINGRLLAHGEFSINPIEVKSLTYYPLTYKLLWGIDKYKDTMDIKTPLQNIFYKSFT